VTLVNLTPHPIAIYGDQTLEQGPRTVIPPTAPAARLATIELGTQQLPYWDENDALTYELVEYGKAHDLPPRQDGRYLIVSLVVALAVHRDDLLAPYVEVRNAEGTMVGCRFLQKVC
jgi:hypothetical protein